MRISDNLGKLRKERPVLRFDNRLVTEGIPITCKCDFSNTDFISNIKSNRTDFPSNAIVKP